MFDSKTVEGLGVQFFMVPKIRKDFVRCENT
jgi:hypothetical protein